MKVLLVHDSLEEIGGAEQIVHATKKILEENGHAVMLYAPAGPGSIVGALFNTSHYFSILKAIRNFKPDIMHVHSIFRNVSPSVLFAAKHRKVPIVMTLHDFQIVCPKTSLVGENLLNCEAGFGYQCFYSNCYPRKPFNRAYQGLKATKLSLHRSIIRRTVRHFISPSVCLMDWTRKNLGVNDVSLLPNFILSDRQPSSTPPKNDTLLFVGKLTEQKGVDVLIRSIAGVRPTIPGIRLKIVGDGPEEEKLKKLAANLQVSDLVTFTGKLSNHKVMEEIDDALCVIIPSKYVENCSMVGIEAMSRGKVIIASNIGGLPDLVDDNISGFLVRPNDPEDLSKKIISIMQNASLASQMGARATAKYLRSFSKEAYYRTLLSVYDRIIHEARDSNAQFR
jgi:glycosyltransferase involved in cell wall biosynthesis